MTAVLTAADLSFNAVRHEYRVPDGRLVPSVTRVLSAVGVSTDFEALRGMSIIKAAAIDHKRLVGQACHADCHAYDDHDLDWETVHPDVLPYVRAWATFRSNLGLKPLTRERIVFHHGLYYCGMLDGIFETPAARVVLADIKTGDPDDAAAHLQTSAYEHAYLAEHPTEVIHERWSVQLIPELQVPYRVHNYSARSDAWNDFRTFQACLTVYFEQPAQRKRSA